MHGLLFFLSRGVSVATRPVMKKDMITLSETRQAIKDFCTDRMERYPTIGNWWCCGHCRYHDPRKGKETCCMFGSRPIEWDI